MTNKEKSTDEEKLTPEQKWERWSSIEAIDRYEGFR